MCIRDSATGTTRRTFASAIGSSTSSANSTTDGCKSTTARSTTPRRASWRKPRVPPRRSNLSFGFDINYVKQRSFENDFALFDYKVLTGHANIYWQPPFLEDTQVTFNIGQYLAKDKGVTVDFAKRFDSGIVVGAYAAFTNVSAEEYGEGSFTKGFYLSIPFDLFSLKPAKGQGRIPWVPIARDGGQALNRPIQLYGVTNERSPFAR